MKTIYHQLITREALLAHFTDEALEAVIAANIGQDALRYQVGHDHFHYDNNSFAVADAYVETLREEARAELAAGNPLLAQEAFGRLTHTVQDFYAHSNYVLIWQSVNGTGDPQRIDPLDGHILQHPDLCSGKLYYPLEVLSFIPALEKHILPFLPTDSHAHMNKDGPNRPLFELAYQAALTRTRVEFDRLVEKLSPEQKTVFTGKN